ncbi:hypothetical protein ACP4OV_029779 [Aristida adscensionis]
MDFDGDIGDQGDMWEWQNQEFDLQKDLLADPSSSLWDEANNNVGDAWSMFDEQTPIKHCTDIELKFCDIGDIIIKDFDERKETLQAKRRRMLQFRPENAEMDCPMTEAGLSESLQMNLDFSAPGEQCLLNSDGIDELPEDWLVNCSQDSEPHCPPEEMKSPEACMEGAIISVNQNSLLCEQSIVVQNNDAQARPTPLKAGRSVIRARRKLSTSVAFPFELIKPCSYHGDVTLSEINQKIHSPSRYNIKHKNDEEPNSFPASAISGKPIVRKTKIHTEGWKGSITIMRTRG